MSKARLQASGSVKGFAFAGFRRMFGANRGTFMIKRFAPPAAFVVLFSASAAAQVYDDAALKKWSSVTAVHYEAVGVLSDKHVRLPADDADLYGDVVERVTLSFDWDKSARKIVGAPKIVNHPAAVSNLVAIEKGCPVGKLNGAYEHFDVVAMEADGGGSIELKGRRIHPETLVTQACGSSMTKFAGGVEEVTTHIGPPDPVMLAYRAMMPADGPVTFTPDGRSMVMKVLNNNWVWTFTPGVK
jgi:hypothetical protein